MAEERGGANLYGFVQNSGISRWDCLGNWIGVDDIIFSVGGALIGLAAEATVTCMTSGEHRPENYVAAGFGGLVTGEALLYVGPVPAGALGGFTTASIREGLRYIRTGKEFDVLTVIFETGVGALTGGIPKLPVAGWTSGRNSLAAIFKQMVTKLRNGNIRRLRTQTAVKMFAGRAGETALIQGALSSGGVNWAKGKAEEYLDPYSRVLDFDGGNRLADVQSGVGVYWNTVRIYDADGNLLYERLEEREIQYIQTPGGGWMLP